MMIISGTVIIVNDQDLRVRKTKRVLQQTLQAALLQEPFSKVTVKALCETALVNRATFYKHYHDKADLLYDVFKELTANSDQISVAELIRQPFSVFPKVVKAPLSAINVKQMDDASFQWVFRQYFYNYYMECFQDVTFKSDVPKALLSYTLVNNGFSFFEWQRDFQLDVDEARMNAYFQELFNVDALEVEE
ncbi:hypothetical protein FD14_GL002341 [Secundilactobacillus similis DSM 23365 = JCM 2765]|uniref:HTH tetR-type domain-containing protein n=1 Tax=Secundilactobacillus similis DSM 23365 = JCM 2765 TaxID=1423804 RepID=A0A0R2FCK9_9LACO|nr:hypothetical protein FD14_GL002341 [Secundilactobacillus similis DSM 23365 = JCM 2765]